MKRTLSILAAALTAFAIFASAAAAAPSSGGDLYVAQAASGTLTGSKLVLQGLAPDVTVFADRPQRSASSLAAARFIAGWKRTFGEDPPNAALEVEGAPKNRDVAIVELRDPRYDRKAGSVVFSVRRLRKSGDSALRSYDVRADGDAVHDFGSASLFIDSGQGATRLALIRVTVGAGQRVSLKFGVPVVADPTFFSGIRTPPTGTLDQISNGEIIVRGEEFSFEASTVGGGLQTETVIQAEVAEDAPLTGTASIPSGSTVEISVENGSPQTLTSGSFSVG